MKEHLQRTSFVDLRDAAPAAEAGNGPSDAVAGEGTEAEVVTDARKGEPAAAASGEQAPAGERPADGGIGTEGKAGEGIEPQGLSKEEANALVASMKEHASVAPIVEVTDESWKPTVETPMGVVKMGENQRTKLSKKGRNSQYGMLLETLSSPDIVLEEHDKEEDATHERPFSYLFIKTFQHEDGTKYVHFESVTVSQDGMEVSISSHILREAQLKNKLKSDRLLYKATALDTPTNASAEQPINEGGSLSSASKGSETSAAAQGNGGNSSDAAAINDASSEAQKIEGIWR